MADSSPPELPSKSALPEGPATRKRVHTYGRLNTAIAVLALATAAYSLWRLDATRERLDEVNDVARTLAADRNALESELRALAQRENQNERALLARIDALNALPKQVQDLNTAVEDLHGRTEGPQRAWSRAEALFLMEIAQRSLVLDRDVATAIAALESADSRLAAVRDPALTSVRQQLARDLQALRTTRVPDRTGLLTRLSAAEAEAARLPVEGILDVERDGDAEERLPDGFVARARAMLGRALTSLIRIREVDERGGALVTTDEQLVRRQHLQLLLFTARSAVARHDQAAYRSALAAARQWLAEFFDVTAPSAQSLLKEIQLLEAIEIDPKLPDISKSTESLQRLTPRGAA
jgi:uroporphyrin-3 C-methyltransferase